MLTILWNHGQGDNISCILDKLYNVTVRKLDDGAPIDRRDTISDVKEATAVSGTAVDDTTNFVWDDWKAGIKGND